MINLDIREIGHWLESYTSGSSPLATLRSLLSLLLPFGFDESIDEVLISKLGIPKPASTTAMGLTSYVHTFHRCMLIYLAQYKREPRFRHWVVNLAHLSKGDWDAPARYSLTPEAILRLTW
jgi:hypothetical protein